MPVELFTIGHSNRSLDEFIAVLADARIDLVVDVRLHPASRRNPQFNQDALRLSLGRADTGYQWRGKALGGMRKPASGSPHSRLAGSGLQGYADYMSSPRFEVASTRLLNTCREQRTAVMCAEHSPMHCHRSLIADWFLIRGHRILHLLEPANAVEHKLRPEARCSGKQLIYDRGAQATLF